MLNLTVVETDYLLQIAAIDSAQADFDDQY
ncbi:MAG: hypothetical protein ACJAYR_003524 [Sneathiella sp.]|jgi:hypothetical protein